MLLAVLVYSLDYANNYIMLVFVKSAHISNKNAEIMLL